MQMAVIELGKNISYIEPTQNPLSANVVMIEGENNLWLYDVGNNPCVPQIISAFNTSNKKINVILFYAIKILVSFPFYSLRWRM